MSVDGSEINLGCIGPLTAHLASRGVDGFVPLGTTGEFPSLSFQEKVEILSEYASVRGDRALIPGCGSCSLRETLDLVRLSAQKGATAVLVPPPFYFRSASPSGIEAWFEAVLAAAEIPVLLYHVPALTGIPIEFSMLERLARFETLWGIKDTGGKLQETSRYLASRPGRILLGSDSTMLDGLTLGVQGTISACANVVPGLLKEIVTDFRRGTDARPAQSRLAAVREALRKFPLHAALKRWLTVQGIEAGSVRPPLLNLSPTEADEISHIARGLDH